MPLLLVRHAVALQRDDWSPPDHLRPLSPQGRAQAAALADLLEPFEVERILSSPARRCVETVEPLAGLTGISVEVVDELAEGSADAAAVLVDPSGPATVLLCTHGDVVPELFEALAGRGSFEQEHFRCAKGSTWVIAGAGGPPKYIPPPAVT